MRMLLPLVFLLPTAASGQGSAPARQEAPQAEPAPAAGRLSLDTPIETILADPAGKAILEKEMASLMAHPAFEQFKALSLKQLQPYSGGAITDEKLVMVEAALLAIGQGKP